MSDRFEIPAERIDTARLTLRALVLEDAPEVFCYSSDPEVSRYTLWAAHKSEDDARAFLKTLLHPTILTWAVCSAPHEKVIGIIFLHSLQVRHRKAELAFNFARASWGKGLATEAARVVVKFGFTRLRLNRIEATCMPTNAASRAVLQKIGMSAEGRMTQSHFRHDGFHDMDLFGIVHRPFEDSLGGVRS